MNIQGIIFIISTIILEISFILIKKVNKKINILTFIGVTIAVNMCYSSFICYILTFFNIQNKLYILSIINYIISAIFIFKILKKKNKNKNISNIQEYTINKTDVFSVLIILIVSCIAGYLNFGFPFNVKYETGDPATHYLTSIKYMQEEKLLTVSEDEVFTTFETRKFASYVNSGLIMKCFEGKIDIIDNYIIFISFGIFILYLTGYLMYLFLTRFAKDNKAKLLALLLTILCIYAYPLNSLLFGFEYMSLSFVVVLAIIEVIFMLVEDKMKLSYSIIILFLLNFGLFCSYYMFVPFVYSAEWIYLCIYSYKKDKKILTKNNFLILTITLIVPFLLGYIYHLEPSIYQIIINKTLDKESILNVPTSIISSGFNAFGYIYTNLYSNFILLAPLALYILIKKFKENKFISLLFVLNVIYIIILLIGRACDKVSYYYLSKNYFTLWIIMFILNYRALIYIFEKDKRIPYLIVSFYIILLIIYLILVPSKMEHEEISSRENPFTIMDIYGTNKYILKECESEFSTLEIELLKKAVNEYDLKQDYLILGDPEQIAWGYSFTREIKENEVTKKIRGTRKFDYTFVEYKDLLKNSKYVIYFKNTAGYKFFEKDLLENAKVIYSNSIGGIIEKER